MYLYIHINLCQLLYTYISHKHHEQEYKNVETRALFIVVNSINSGN